jgi:transposase
MTGKKRTNLPFLCHFDALSLLTVTTGAIEMTAGAQLTVTDKRRAARHPVEHKVIAEHRQLGDLHLHIVNLSAQGFMSQGDLPLERGERLVMRLPVIGRIEAHLIWAHEGRAGFQFERIIRIDDFLKLVDTVQPNPRLRPRR